MVSEGRPDRAFSHVLRRYHNMRHVLHRNTAYPLKRLLIAHVAVLLNALMVLLYASPFWEGPCEPGELLNPSWNRSLFTVASICNKTAPTDACQLRQIDKRLCMGNYVASTGYHMIVGVRVPSSARPERVTQ